MNCFGLTNHPERRKEELGSPADWRQRVFRNETKARQWAEEMAADPAQEDVTEGGGWEYGYTFTRSSES